MKFHENSSSGNRVVPCGQTDRHDEANNRFSQFCENVPECLKRLTEIASAFLCEKNTEHRNGNFLDGSADCNYTYHWALKC
jgi:hypothetical protein